MQKKIIFGLSLLSLAIFILSRFIPSVKEFVRDRDMLKASAIMAQAI